MANLYDKLGIKDLDQMVNSTLQEIVDSNVNITNVSVGSVVRTIVEAILSNIDETNYYIGYVYGALNIDDATGDDLDRCVAIWGVTRKPATHATGIVTFSTGDEPYGYDISIPYGYEVSTRQTADGVVHVYRVNEEDAILPAGETSIDVEVICEEAGHKYLPSGSLCIMGKSIIGIASVVNNNEINGGEDKESDADFRIRTKKATTSFGKCTDSAIEVAVSEIDGVSSCRTIDQYRGLCTTGVIVVPDVLPVLDRVDNEVKRVVNETKASGVRPYIVYPTIKYIDIEVSITKAVDDNLVLNAVSEYVNSLKVGQTFVIKQMERKILNIIDDNNNNNDDIDITTIIPQANIECDEEEIIRVSKITVNGVEHNV